MIGWIWKERKNKTPMKFKNKTATNGVEQSVVRVNIEFVVNHPPSLNIVEVIRNIDATFDLPQGVVIDEANIVDIELRGN